MSEETLTRKERDRLVRETDFLNSAEHLFAQKGFHETSMEDVAKDAEYATGTIYRYFESKESLYHALLLRKGRTYFSHTQSCFAAATDAESKLRTLIRGKVAFFADNWDFLRIYMSELPATTGPSATGCQPPEELKAEFENYLSNLRAVFVEGMAAGLFRTLNPDYVVSAYTGMSNEFLRSSLGENATSELILELEAFLFDFITLGLLTDKRMSK